ncbi:MAG TPA: amidohydrolase family protein, partial [Acidobacteriaceae bacterium]
VERGELDGPMIYTAGSGIYPPKGIPFYLRENMPGWMLRLMPQPATPQKATDVVTKNLKRGADITKLFTGSWVERGKVLPMPLDVAKAAVERTHLDGRLVFAHPSSLAGTRVAIDSGVDVLAHAPDDTEGIGPELFGEMVNRNMAMIPTLKMFTTTVTSNPHYMDPIRAEVKSFHEQGGQLIFGTDVGYMNDYTTEGEFVELGRSGLNTMDVLAMLTVNPAARFGVTKLKGTVTQGKLADLTVLSADPAEDLKNFSAVQMTIRSGRVIYQR